jgi:hypothetical protein
VVSLQVSPHLYMYFLFPPHILHALPISIFFYIITITILGEEYKSPFFNCVISSRSRFSPSIVHVVFVVNNMTLGQFFLWILKFSSQSFFHQAPYPAVITFKVCDSPNQPTCYHILSPLLGLHFYSRFKTFCIWTFSCHEIVCTVLQKQDDCQHESLNSAPADMEGELLINMVTRAVTAIMSRLNTLSNSDVPESKVCLTLLSVVLYHRLNKVCFMWIQTCIKYGCAPVIFLQIECVPVPWIKYVLCESKLV